MSDKAKALRDIAEALRRLAPEQGAATDWTDAPAYRWNSETGEPVSAIEAPELDLLAGIDQAKSAVTHNVARHAQGHAAHDMLLWGARGMGKSALLRAAVRDAQMCGAGDIALIQLASDHLDSLPGLFAQLGEVERSFLVFIDDLGFGAGEDAAPRRLRSVLDGGVAARPANTRIAVTSNRRAIVERHMAEQDDPVNPRDVVDDQLALADRFGLSLGFHNCDQPTYLAIVEGYAARHGLAFAPEDALQWAKRRGARSGRVAWHYIVELAGRAGKAL